MASSKDKFRFLVQPGDTDYPINLQCSLADLKRMYNLVVEHGKPDTVDSMNHVEKMLYYYIIEAD